MTTTTLGLVVALRAEARALAGREMPTERVVTLQENVLLWVGGMGGAAAERACGILLGAGAKALASVGTAAGLAPGCEPGAVVLPQRVCGTRGEVFEVDPEWHAALAATLQPEFRLRTGTLAAVEAVIGVNEKRALHERSGAVAADMESGAVGHAAQAAGIPLLVLRAVSDGPRDASPPELAGVVDAFGRVRAEALVGALLKNPAALGALVRLRRGFRSALATLGRVTTLAGPALRCP